MRHTLSLGLLFCLASSSEGAGPVSYTEQVKPILVRHCVSCHGPEKQRSSLRLDARAFLLQGGNRGPAVAPGKADESLLLKAVTGTGGMPRMPQGRPALSPPEVALLRTWIDEGAKGPADEAVAADARSQHWSFRPVKRAPLPAVKQAGWVRNPVDHFVLARLEKEGIRPSSEADRVTLIRRLSLDLLGLPPSPAEVDAFVADTRANAYELLVERLLASPHHGERWGRHWLDLARYADSNGYSIDGPRSIWPYRDWVINALNRDMPFDQFTVAQLAGDLLPGASQSQLVATGFHRNTQINQEGGIDLEQFRVESLIDRVNTTGAVWLGVTLGCAQCHDHKYDPFSQKEYYQILAYFNSVDEPTLELAAPEQLRRRRDIQGRLAGLRKELQQLDPTTPERVEKWEGGLTPEALAMLPAEIQHYLSIAINGRNTAQQQAIDDAYRKADQTRHAVGGLGQPFLAAAHGMLLTRRVHLLSETRRLEAELPVIPTTMIVRERKTPRESYIHLGGDFLRKGATVQPHTPAILHRTEEGQGQSRLDFARWLVDARNPLTPRVLVNRIWQQYFGLGIVETENDFGTQGTPPSHPELLDWLAGEVVARKWSLKAMHRLIVTSATYRQSSHARPDLATVDPRNRLLARQSRLRLEAEVVRDAALAVSGLLAPTVGGQGVFPPQPDGIYRFTQVPRTWSASRGPDRYRRGLYTYFWRSAPHPGLIVFDAPDASATCTRRNRSNTPLQALTLLNDEAFLECASALARRVLSDQDASADAERLRQAFRLCVAREPSARELEVLARMLRLQRESLAEHPEEARSILAAVPGRPKDGVSGQTAVDEAAWTMVARVLLNLDETITRE